MIHDELGWPRAVFPARGCVVCCAMVVAVDAMGDYTEHVEALTVPEEKAAYSSVRLRDTQRDPGSLASNVMTTGAHVAVAPLAVVTTTTVCCPVLQVSCSDAEDMSVYQSRDDGPQPQRR
jgi:hypothetical protein